MAFGKMDRVAKLLGVGEKEEFIITSDDKKIKVYITLEGLYTIQPDGSKVKDDGRLLNDILLGAYDIEKKPWQPKENEQYFYPAVFHKQVRSATWDGCTDGYALKLLGMIYRTKEEAQDHFVEDFKKLTGEDLEKYYVETNDYKNVDYKKKFEALIRMIDRNCYGSSNDDMVPAKYLNRVAREASRLENYANYYGEEDKERANL